jgi:signal transduction histidine kinase
MAEARPTPTGAVEPGMTGLWLGVLVYRWVTLAWMTILALVGGDTLRRPVLAYVTIAVVVGWNVWFGTTRAWERGLDRNVDLAISFLLLPISGLVMEEGTAAASKGTPFFAVSYPASSALTVGAGEGLAAGLFASGVLSIGLFLSRVTNSALPLSGNQWANLLNGFVYYVAAGGATGTVSRALRRSASDRAAAIEEAARERERAARLAEREALGRRIHDSVLQALAMIAKQGRQLADRPTVESGEIRELVGLAATEERALRRLLTEELPTPGEGGNARLGPALHEAAATMTAVPVSVNTTGDPVLDSFHLDELTAAIRQALDNVAQHADAGSVTIFGEEIGTEVIVSIRDDGVGFDYDEGRLERDGKFGLLRSMKGRIEGIGGQMRVRSVLGQGTEIEFRLPVREEVPRG